MWFLEHESLFGGKRVWLRPGSQQLFGRTRAGDTDGPVEKAWQIENKAVSRKHVMLKIVETPPEDGTKLHTRSQIEVTDLSCRQGTTIDERETLKSQKADDGSITYKQTTLKGTEHTIRLAQGYAPFKVVWRPVVITYASKESRECKMRSAQLHALDIKTTSEFLFDKTTHVVSSKRNLPKVLSGLTAGKHIVTTSFLDAVLKAATNSLDMGDIYVPSKLEEDFDAWWPREKEYIPPIGAEPVPQPQEKLEPDATRSEVFSGLTFILLEAGQYNNLLDPITGGGGKALLYAVRPGGTTVQEFVDYVHSVAGKKRRTTESKQTLSVITVRLQTYPDAMVDWATNFFTGTDQSLGQRSILQNEFLDAIVTKDRSSLLRPPAEIPGKPAEALAPEAILARQNIRDTTPDLQAAVPIQTNQSRTSPTEPGKVETLKVIPRKRVQRPKTTSRFTGFDDYEPPTKRKKADRVATENFQPSVINTDVAEMTSQAHDPRTSREQAASHMDKEEQMDTLFPTAAKFRRERAATRAPFELIEADVSEPLPESKHKGVEALQRLNHVKAKAEKEINVREHTRLRIKEEEERRKADEETLREALQGIDISELKNLAKIEEMTIRPRPDRGSAAARGLHSSSRGPTERWDPAWNGRKNFKKFRRRGVENGLPPYKVLVPLEEAAPKKGLGLGDAFFLEDMESLSRSRREADGGSSEPEPGFTRRKRTTPHPNEIIHVEDSGLEAAEEEVVLRTHKSSGRTQRVVETQIDATQTQIDATQTQTQTQTQRGRKRGPVATVVGEPTSKRGKANASHRNDDSDEEETGFRFRRRRG